MKVTVYAVVGFRPEIRVLLDALSDFRLLKSAPTGWSGPEGSELIRRRQLAAAASLDRRAPRGAAAVELHTAPSRAGRVASSP